MSFILAYRKPKEKLARSRAPSVSSTREDVRRPASGPYRLLKYEELPAWYQDNHFTRSGYRPEARSWVRCVSSLGHLHNESVNIFTHLVPAVLFLILQLSVVDHAIDRFYPDATLSDHVVFGVNVAAATVTMLLSTTYHTLMCHSAQMENLTLRIDYVGILTLILGSFFSGIYVGFYCEPLLRWTYWVMIISLSLITAVLVLHPRLQGLKYRPHRTWAFIATALSGFAPIIHGLLLYGWSQMWVRSGMPYWFLEGLVYGGGAFFFVTRVPESIWPGRFDIWFSSHQFFHVAVVVASLVHLGGVWSAYDWTYRHQRTCLVQYP